MRRCDDSSLRPGRRLALGLAALALVASTLTGPAGAAVVEVGPVAPGWGVRIASRTNVSTTVLDQVVLPDGGVLALVSCNGGIGIVGGGRWVGVDEAPDQDGLAVVRIEPDGTLSWATLAISGLIGNARGYSALVRTADGRVRALTNTQGTVHGPTPTDVAGLAVAEIDPTTGEVLGGGAVAVRSTGPVFAAAAGDDVVVSTSFVGSVDVGLAPPRTTVTTEATGLARLSSNQLVTRLVEQGYGSAITRRDLALTPPALLTESWVGANFTDDADRSVLVYLRKHDDDVVLVACNFTPVPREGYEVQVPTDGAWDEVLNTDAEEYGGSGIGNLGSVSASGGVLTLTLPPLAAVYLRPAG